MEVGGFGCANQLAQGRALQPVLDKPRGIRVEDQVVSLAKWPAYYTAHHLTNKKSQPKILEAFAQLWGTDDLIASFDGINVTLPINEEHGRTDIYPTGAWPRKRNKHLISPPACRYICN